MEGRGGERSDLRVFRTSSVLPAIWTAGDRLSEFKIGSTSYSRYSPKICCEAGSGNVRDDVIWHESSKVDLESL